MSIHRGMASTKWHVLRRLQPAGRIVDTTGGMHDTNVNGDGSVAHVGNTDDRPGNGIIIRHSRLVSTFSNFRHPTILVCSVCLAAWPPFDELFPVEFDRSSKSFCRAIPFNTCYSVVGNTSTLVKELEYKRLS